jgi:hypothetical protein
MQRHVLGGQSPEVPALNSLKLAYRVRAVGEEKGITAVQRALTWMLTGTDAGGNSTTLSRGDH